MTGQERDAKIREIIFAHLRARGWPHSFSSEQVMEELPVIWDLLVAEPALIPDHWTYEMFYQIAFAKYLTERAREIERQMA